jgi:hypothetical protein
MDEYTKLVFQQDRTDADQDVSFNDKDLQHQMTELFSRERSFPTNRHRLVIQH